jgi:hypothetical protein
MVLRVYPLWMLAEQLPDSELFDLFEQLDIRKEVDRGRTQKGLGVKLL